MSFGSVRDRLPRFQEHHVEAAKPFQWTLTRRDLIALLAKLGRRPVRAAQLYGATEATENYHCSYGVNAS